MRLEVQILSHPIGVRAGQAVTQKERPLSTALFPMLKCWDAPRERGLTTIREYLTMANDIVPSVSTEELIAQWIEAERNGVQFPVPLHDHWGIAGHKKVQDAFGLLESRQEEGFDFLRSTVRNGKRGQPRQARFLSVAALERFCLAAHTSQGDVVRELYRQAKNKWDLVQQQYPAIAQEIELQELRNQGLQLEYQKAQVELQLIQFRHIVATTLPEPIQQKVLGYKEVTTVEYRDRIIHNDDIINDGNTILKGDLCHRYGLLTKAGKPDYKRLNEILEELPGDAFQLTARIQDNRELLRAYLPELDQLVRNSNRQRWIGE